MGTSGVWQLAGRSDEEVLSRLHVLVSSTRQLSAELVAHLGEVEERRLHLKAACGSMFQYCTTRLGLSEDEACRRIDVARLARRFPALFPALARGELSLSVAALLKPHLCEENHVDLVRRLSGKSVRQAQECLAALFPRPDVPSSIRKLPNRTAPLTISSPPSVNAITPPTPSTTPFETAFRAADNTWAAAADRARASAASHTADAAAERTRASAANHTVAAASASNNAVAMTDHAQANAASHEGAAAAERTRASAANHEGAATPGQALANDANHTGAGVADGHELRGANAGSSGAPDRFQSAVANELRTDEPNHTSSSAGHDIALPRDAGALPRDAGNAASASAGDATPGNRDFESVYAPRPSVAAERRRPTGRLEPLSADRYRVQFSASRTLKEKLELARDLMRHANPSGDLAPIVERGLDLLLDQLMRRRFGKTRNAGHGAVAPSSQCGVPATPPTHQTPSTPADVGLPNQPKRRAAPPQPTRPSPPTHDSAPTHDPLRFDSVPTHDALRLSVSTHDALRPASAPASPAIDALSSPQTQTSTNEPRLPRTGQAFRSSQREHITNATRRAVVERDGLQCCWVDDQGRRCASRAWLEVDHQHPRGKGGSSEAHNTRILCRAHNRFAAEREYGRDHIERAVQEARPSAQRGRRDEAPCGPGERQGTQHSAARPP